jgi:hypothetical protein
MEGPSRDPACQPYPVWHLWKSSSPADLISSFLHEGKKKAYERVGRNGSCGYTQFLIESFQAENVTGVWDAETGGPHDEASKNSVVNSWYQKQKSLLRWKLKIHGQLPQKPFSFHLTETFHIFFGRSDQLNSVIKTKEIKSAVLKDCSNFHSLCFSERHVLMLANSFEKKVSFLKVEN